jgi:hypothetical protein
MRYTVDAGDLDRLAADLEAAPAKLKPEVDRVIERGALNIRRGAQKRIRDQITGVYLPHYPRAITYDIEEGATFAEAEVGPESAKPQGGMGPAIEYGTSRAAPMPHLLPAYDAEIPRLVHFLSEAAEGVLR